MLLFGMNAHATDALPGWLPTRDSNPFAIATGLPLTPAVPAPGTWQFDASWSIANTELQQTDGNASLLFDAETRETRFSAAYAFDPRWSLRASISHFRVGSGFLDGPVERFHRAFGFDNGDRGQLGTQAPQIEVRDDGELLYVLNDARSDSGPLLADLTRSWDFGDRPDWLTSAASDGCSLVRRRFCFIAISSRSTHLASERSTSARAARLSWAVPPRSLTSLSIVTARRSLGQSCRGLSRH
jgi:hypothetical protein